MAKDPAINWYFDNWGGGTKGFNRFQKGCYMELLEAQFQLGHLSLEQIKNVLGSDFSAWQTIKTKFVQDESGNFFNERMELEIKKRQKYSESRANNRKGKKDMNNISKSYDEHMKNTPETETETETNYLLMSELKIENCKLPKESIGFKVMESSIKLYNGFCKEFPLNRDLPLVEVKDWIPPVRELMEKKKYRYDQIAYVLNYAVGESFWRKIIMNTQSLAKHFETIKAQYQQTV